jgi:hypothetical protein
MYLSSTFGGKSAVAVAITNLVLNPNFTSTASWNNTAGWGSTVENNQLFSNSTPSIKTNDTGQFASYVMFSYPSTPHTITQTISLSTPKSSYTFSYYVSTNFNGSVVDKYYAKATFRNASNTVIQEIGILSLANISSTTWTQETFTTTVSMTTATSVTITLAGYDVKFWAGNYGPRFTAISLT